MNALFKYAFFLLSTIYIYSTARLMKVAFLESFLNIRGTTVALFDYATYNETLLGNQSIIITQPFFRVENFEDASFDVYTKFKKRFPVFHYETRDDIQSIVDRERPDVLYVIKSGARDDGLHGFRGVKIFVHCVFHPQDPHGDHYAVISPWLNAANKRNFPVLPHIVHLPDTTDDLRAELGIPADSVVFGRHGGYGDFDHPDAQSAVRRIVAEGHGHVFFVFLNTQPFLPYSPNVIFLPKTTCPLYKTKFINTCDAMIYGRSRGETFGLAIGEFSSRNKPIFAALQAPDRMHHVVLQHKAYWFLDADDLYRKMVTFRPVAGKDWNQYRAFSPENVMQTFQDQLQQTLRNRTCFVTLCWDTPLGRLPDVGTENELIVFVHERFQDLVPKVVGPNVFIKVIDEYFVERFKIRKRKDREAEAINAPAYRQLVGSRASTLPADPNLRHCHVELLGWAAERMSRATHFAWMAPSNTTNVPLWYLQAADPHRVNYFLERPLDPATDGQVMNNLKHGVHKVDASFFGGSREAVLTYREVYRGLHDRLLQQGIVDDDRHLALLCMVEAPSLFRMHGPTT